MVGPLPTFPWGETLVWTGIKNFGLVTHKERREKREKREERENGEEREGKFLCV
jgi:hypothetical protein